MRVNRLSWDDSNLDSLVSVSVGFPNLLEIDSLRILMILYLNWVKAATRNMGIIMLGLINLPIIFNNVVLQKSSILSQELLKQ